MKWLLDLPAARGRAGVLGRISLALTIGGLDPVVSIHRFHIGTNADVNGRWAARPFERSVAVEDPRPASADLASPRVTARRTVGACRDLNPCHVTFVVAHGH